MSMLVSGSVCLSFVQRIADIVAHIITERSMLFGKLQNIAELTRF